MLVVRQEIELISSMSVVDASSTGIRRGSPSISNFDSVGRREAESVGMDLQQRKDNVSTPQKSGPH